MYDIVIVNLGGHDKNVEQLSDQFPHARILRYHGTHLSTIKRAMRSVITEYAWIIFSCCDYSDFDFGWTPPWHQATQLHCWASGNQKFGDTFLIHKKSWLQQKDKLERDGNELLEYYEHICWHENGVSRLPWPTHKKLGDIVDKIKNHKFDCVYEWFLDDDKVVDIDDICLWYEQRPFYIFGKYQSHVLMPREAKKYPFDYKNTRTSRYTDYPNLKFENIEQSITTPNDVIFISNGESTAEQTWNRLKEICPRAKRINGINGREAAYHAAAKASDTVLFFAVFPKIEIVDSFDFKFQTNKLEPMCHRIFQNQNPINGLTYGHMAMILYHKYLLLNTKNALDYTLEAPHQLLPIVASKSIINDDFWLIWRTAFREAVKLAVTDRIETKYMLHKWCTSDQTDSATISSLGAKAGKQYAYNVKFDSDKLKLSVDWKWLEEYFQLIYGFDKQQISKLIS